MSNRIVLDLSHRPGNPRNSEGAFVTLADRRILEEVLGNPAGYKGQGA